MGLHLYCVVPPQQALADAGGIEDARVRAVTAGPLTVLVSDHDSRPTASLDSIRQHNAVVVAAMDERTTPVPIRFGQWLDDDDAVRAAMDGSATDWRALLDLFAGSAEFGIRIFDPATPPAEAEPRPQTGREYMAALVGRTAGPAARQKAAVDALREATSGLFSREKVEPLRTQHGVASVAYLVHRRQFNAYQKAVDEVRTRMPHLRYLSTGPWPPYSFIK